MPDAIITAGLHFAFLGLPALVLHYVLARLRWWTLTTLGAVCGLLPTAIWSWPLMMPGEPALEAWAGYGAAVGAMAGFGAVAGSGFWFTWALWERFEPVLDTVGGGP